MRDPEAEARRWLAAARADELDRDFLENLKSLFKNREIEIAVSEVAAGAEDKTAYLLESPANRQRLLRAIENIASNRNLVAMDIDELQ